MEPKPPENAPRRRLLPIEVQVQNRAWFEANKHQIAALYPDQWIGIKRSAIVGQGLRHSEINARIIQEQRRDARLVTIISTQGIEPIEGPFVNPLEINNTQEADY